GRRDSARLGARQHRRLPLWALVGDDDRVGETLRAAVAAQDRVGSLTTGPLHGDLLQLGLELLLGQLAALQPGAGFHDLFDVELEDFAPAEPAFRPLAPPPGPA